MILTVYLLAILQNWIYQIPGGWGGRGGGGLSPQLGTDAWTKDRRKDPILCVPSFCENKPFRSVVWETAPFHCLANFNYP